MFQPVEPKPDFPALERALLDRWDADRVFERSVEERPADQEWSFYDGPPFATGLPHYGHLLAGTMKDVVPRFWTMRGKRVRRVWGWDCHGLPVEYEIEKDLKLGGKKDIEAMGVGAFNDACRATVLRYTKEWAQTVRRMGRWVDMKNAYRTMDPDFMESIWWAVKTLWEKDLVYKGHKSMHICPRCATPLSNFEASQNYKDVTDTSVIPRFEDAETPGRFFLAWTTTPWTLPGNVLLAVNPSIPYAEVECEGATYVLAWDRVPHVFKDREYSVVRELKAEELVGRRYAPLFPYFGGTKNAFRVATGDFVTTDEGTGIVHIAPAFGEEDYQLGQREEVPLVQHVTMQGTFIDAVTDWAGKDAKPSDKEIIRHLKDDGKLFAAIPVTHAYPHCWRCETPLLNYAMAAWFVKVERLRDRLLSTNEEIRWMPEHLKHGRFGKWLENARDWNISRNRYWGTPLPIWVGESGETLVIGSREELVVRSRGQIVKDGHRYLVAKTGEELDLHKQYVDDLVLYGDDGAEMRRIPEVLDCWFESGAMPYAQRHFPFENEEAMRASYPADFIAEGLDQTRGWFYTLHVLANALELTGAPTPAFRNVVVNGLVLAEDGQKMSKSKKNYPDPNLLIERYGADAVRFAFMASPAVRGEDLRFSERLVAEVVKTVHLPLWNTLSFFATYAAAAGYESAPLPKTLGHELDRWIIAATEDLTRTVTAAYEAYDLQGASRPIADYLDGLTNWYVRLSRKRFAAEAEPADRAQAFATLEHVLRRLALLLAPVTPFLAELVWERLGEKGSIHLAMWPDTQSKTPEENLLVGKMNYIRHIVKLGLAVRAKTSLPVRQTLASATVGYPDLFEGFGIKESAELIKSELNVLDVIFATPEHLVKSFIRPNPRILGKKYGKDVQMIIQAAKRGEYRIEDDGIHVLNYVLEHEEVDFGYEAREGVNAEGDAGFAVALDTHITPELAAKGMLRQLARAVNDARKALGLRVGEPARLHLRSPALEKIFADGAAALEEMKERLALTDVRFGSVPKDAHELELDGESVQYTVERL